MAADLLAARRDLDRRIDRAFGFAKTPTLEARPERLFNRCVEATTAAGLI